MRLEIRTATRVSFKAAVKVQGALSRHALESNELMKMLWLHNMYGIQDNF